MKKFIALMLAAILVLGSAIPVLAIENSAAPAVENSATINISIESIESIMLSNSSNMALAKNNFDKAALTYQNALSDYNKVKKQYDALVLNTSADWAQALSLSNQLDSLRNNMNSAKFNLDAAQLIYNQQVQQFVLAAKQQYLSYLSALTQNQISAISLSSQENQLAGLMTKLTLGYVSKKQVDTFATQVSDLRTSFSNQEEQAKVLLEKLRSYMGILETATVTVSNVVTFDFTSIPAIVFDSDLSVMLANSTDIKTKEISLKSINKTASSSNDPSKYRYDIISAEISLSQAKEKAKLDFQDQYIALKNSDIALKAKIVKLNVKKTELAGMVLRAKLGFASKKQVQDIQLEVKSQELQILMDQQNLYASFIRYNLTKLGY